MASGRPFRQYQPETANRLDFGGETGKIEKCEKNPPGRPRPRKRWCENANTANHPAHCRTCVEERAQAGEMYMIGCSAVGSARDLGARGHHP